MASAPTTSIRPNVRLRPRGRRWLRRVGIAALIPVLFGIVLWLISPSVRLITNIFVSGGTYHTQHHQWMHERMLLRWEGKPFYEGRVVALRGAAFDDAWLAQHDDLALLQPTSLSLFDTGLGRDAVRRLVQKYSFTDCYIVGTPVTDDEVALLAAGHPQLMCVALRKTEITDEGLAMLNVAGLHLLDVANSPVTAAALQAQLAGGKLTWIGLDGRQFTPELAAALASLPILQDVDLVGPEVTDAHLDLVKSLPQLRRVYLEQTSVTDGAIESLKAAHQNPELFVQRLEDESGE